MEHSERSSDNTGMVDENTQLAWVTKQATKFVKDNPEAIPFKDPYGMEQLMLKKPIDKTQNMCSKPLNEQWKETLPVFYETLGASIETRLRTTNAELMSQFTDATIEEAKDEEKVLEKARKEWDGNTWITSFNKKLEAKSNKMLREDPNSYSSENKRTQKRGRKPQISYSSVTELFEAMRSDKDSWRFADKISQWAVIAWDTYLTYSLTSNKMFDRNFIAKQANALGILWGKKIGFNLDDGKLLCFAALNPSKTWFASITSAQTQKLLKHLKIPKEISDVTVKIVQSAESMITLKNMETLNAQGNLSCHTITKKYLDRLMNQLHDLGIFGGTYQEYEEFALNNVNGQYHKLMKKEVKSFNEKAKAIRDTVILFGCSMSKGWNTSIDQMAASTEVEEEKAEMAAYYFGQNCSTIFNKYDYNLSSANLMGVQKEIQDKKELEKYKNDFVYVDLPEQLPKPEQKHLTAGFGYKYDKTPDLDKLITEKFPPAKLRDTGDTAPGHKITTTTREQAPRKIFTKVD